MKKIFLRSVVVVFSLVLVAYGLYFGILGTCAFALMLPSGARPSAISCGWPLSSGTGVGTPEYGEWFKFTSFNTFGLGMNILFWLLAFSLWFFIAKKIWRYSNNHSNY